MRRYTFRLETILRVRLAERQLARERLFVVNERLRDALGYRDQMRANYAALECATGALSPDELRREIAQHERLAAMVRDAEERASVVAAEAALAQLEWSEAERRVEVLERLDARRRSEWLNADRLAETAENDDIANATFTRELASAAEELFA